MAPFSTFVIFLRGIFVTQRTQSLLAEDTQINHRPKVYSFHYFPYNIHDISCVFLNAILIGFLHVPNKSLPFSFIISYQPQTCLLGLFCLDFSEWAQPSHMAFTHCACAWTGKNNIPPVTPIILFAAHLPINQWKSNKEYTQNSCNCIGGGGEGRGEAGHLWTSPIFPTPQLLLPIFPLINTELVPQPFPLLLLLPDKFSLLHIIAALGLGASRVIMNSLLSP